MIPIDGKAHAQRLREAVAARVAARAGPRPPGLAVVLVGEDPASAVYVRNKGLAAEAAGIAARTLRHPATLTQAELLAIVADLNADPEVDGILVQLPLPPHIDPAAVIAAIDPAKDVDGFHPVNAGRLAAGLPALTPCTPLGVMRLLESTLGSVAGLHAVVVGRSQIVGRPMASLLINASATVTVAHSRTRDLPEHTRRADIVVAAVGRPEMIRGDWVKPGATVIDVGINRITRDNRSMLVGDVAYAELAHAAHATPVPGGVGPMTIACLLENTLTACEARTGQGQ